MDTPIVDFVQQYISSNTVRLHMPGHKGKPILGSEPWDITEINGADALYEAEGIIAESEANAAALFGTARTIYSTEGSSQCIRAMVHLAARGRGEERPWILAARNAHKAFVYALALNDVDVKWLWPEKMSSICSCAVTAEQVDRALAEADSVPGAVYVTSPDYLGHMQPIAEIAAVCHRHGTLLLVDNAHGAYLHFLEEPLHPMDLGADLCCDSAHKTLPVLTGGAYLHFGRNAPGWMADSGKSAMELFGSTSPSYLIMESLDSCNRYLADGFRGALKASAASVRQTCQVLREQGWQVEEGEPLKITVRCPKAFPGLELAASLRARGIECEYADRDYLVLMVSTGTMPEELIALTKAMGENTWGSVSQEPVPIAKTEIYCSPRQAVFAPREQIPVREALGRIAAAPTVGCPPAIPIVVSGERIDQSALELFGYYGIETVCVLK